MPPRKVAAYGDDKKMQDDPNFQGLYLFYEYFNGDTGMGLGASSPNGLDGPGCRSDRVLVQIQESGSTGREVTEQASRAETRLACSVSRNPALILILNPAGGLCRTGKLQELAMKHTLLA